MSELITYVQGIKWVDDETALNAENMNKIEQRISINDSNIRTVSKDLDKYKESTNSTLTTLSEVTADKITEWNNKFGPTANYENAQRLVETYQLQADVDETNTLSKKYIQNKNLLVTNALETDKSKLSYLKNREALVADYEAKELLDDGSINLAYIKNKPEKIGDVRITTRNIDDPNWLLCDHTKINRDSYQTLYDLLPTSNNIFFEKWNEVKCKNAGIPPYLGEDEYFYSINEATTFSGKAFRGTSLSDMESYTPTVISNYMKCINGYWCLVAPGRNSSSISVSKNGFYSSDSDMTKTVLLSDIYGVDAESSKSFIRYDANSNKYRATFCTRDEYNYYSMLENDNIFSDEWTGVSTCTISDLVDIITFKNDKRIIVSGGSSSGLDIDFADVSLSSYSDITSKGKRLRSGFYSGYYSKYGYPTYIQELDVVIATWYTSSSSNDIHSVIISNDGNIRHLEFLATSAVFYRGFLYVSTKDGIYRAATNGTSIDTSWNLSDKYVPKEHNQLVVLPGDSALCISKDDDTLYVIADDTEKSIPPAFPDSIYKTYIKCK